MLIFDSQGVVVLSSRVHVELGAVTGKRLKRTGTEQPVKTLCKNRVDQELVMKSLLDQCGRLPQGVLIISIFYLQYMGWLCFSCISIQSK